MTQPIVSNYDLFRLFSGEDEESARTRLESVRWGGHIICPHCGSHNIYTRTGKRTGIHDCRDCLSYFSVRTGTVFENSRIALRDWIHAIYLLMTAHKDISSIQLSKEMGVTQKTGWLILHRLHTACGGNMEALRGMVGGAGPMSRLDAGLSHVMSYRPEHLTENPCILVQGDATKRDTLKRECADLIVTSPPYNIGKAYNGYAEADEKSYDDYLKFSKKWLRNCYFWTRPTGRLCVNVSIDKNRNGKVPLSADITKIAMDAGWSYHATIIWNEGNISRRTAWGSWKSASAPHIIAPVETIIVLYKGRWKRERQGTSDISGEEFKDWVLGVWNFNGESAKRIGHEAPFPRALPERCIKLLSFPGDTVLDPFAGSGTTLIEAVERGRSALGIELEKKYCDLIKQRIEKECKVRLETSQQVTPAKSTLLCWAA